MCFSTTQLAGGSQLNELSALHWGGRVSSRKYLYPFIDCVYFRFLK